MKLYYIFKWINPQRIILFLLFFFFIFIEYIIDNLGYLLFSEKCIYIFFFF